MIINEINLSEELDIELMEKSIQPPSSNRIIEIIPYMNGEYDFSNLYDELTFEEREITCKYAIPTTNTEMLNIRYSQLLDLIMKYELIIEFKDIKGYYFKGKIINAPNFEEISVFGTLTVIYSCYPFKISKYDEGNIPWDDFNFELDYIQETKFDVSGSRTIRIINSSSKNITPTVVCSSEFNVIKDSTTYKFNAGTTKDWRFTFGKGENNLILNGTGNIEFIFRKEVL